MRKYVMVNCRDATFLMAKKEERKISFSERIKLRIHTSFCSVCKKFEKQTLQIRKESRHLHSEAKLSATVKAEIERMLKEHSY